MLNYLGFTLVWRLSSAQSNSNFNDL